MYLKKSMENKDAFTTIEMNDKWNIIFFKIVPLVFSKDILATFPLNQIETTHKLLFR